MMSWSSTRTGKVAQGTVIALVTWGVLYLTKENLGRTAALILAAVILALFILALFLRAQIRAGGQSRE